MKKLLLFLCLMMLPVNAMAVCMGIVYGPGGSQMPLRGARVVVKETNAMAITAMDGSFRIDNCIPGHVLIVNAAGLATRQFCVGTAPYVEIGMCTEDLSEECGTNTGEGDTCCLGVCSNCSTTNWIENIPGYQERTLASCDTNTCRCSKTTERRCASGYFGSYESGGKCFKNCPEGFPGYCGNVVSAETGEPIKDFPVVLLNRMANTTRLMAKTDADGRFSAPSVPGDTAVFFYPGKVRQDFITSTGIMLNMYVSIASDTGPIECNDGYYVDWSSGKSVCKKCPDFNGVPGSSQYEPIKDDITYCYIPTTNSFTDAKGSYNFASKCYYR